jgi:predicted protein tyrosine phosphatase
MPKLLFICSRNRWRSPTAEQIYEEYPGIETASAGLSPDADNPLTPELIEWADLIFVMEQTHKAKLKANFSKYLAHKRVICLGIPDKYTFMHPQLVNLLKTKVDRFLPR